MEAKTLTVGVNVYDEYFDGEPTHIIVPVTEDIISYVKKAQQLVKENDV